MSGNTDGNDAGRSSAEGGNTTSPDPNVRQAVTRREAIARLEPDQTPARPAQSRDIGAWPPSEPRPVSASAHADSETLKNVDRRHDGLQGLEPGALGRVAAREAAASDVSALNSFADKTLQARAAAVMGDTADQQVAYKTALLESSPQYAGLTERAFAAEQQMSAAKEARKSLEYAGRRDDAADSIASRYATVASAGLSVNDLQGPARDRLAIEDSRDLMLIDEYPPHPRAGESKALVADSLKSDAYRATFDRETAEWAAHGAGPRPGLATRTSAVEPNDRVGATPAPPTEAKDVAKAPLPVERTNPEANSMRLEGDTATKRPPIPPLEDRFNVKRIGFVEKEYHFRDQAGKVAFTDKFRSISTAGESPAAIKAMVDRAAERGWETVKLTGSPEFVRQGWIAATAQGLKAVGHTASMGDQDMAARERARLRVVQAGTAPQRQGEATGRVQLNHSERTSGDRNAADHGAQRQLAAAIEKALAEGKVSPELRGQVRGILAIEGARRVAKGERFQVPVYDARAPRTRTRTVQGEPQRQGNRERSR